MTTLEIDGASFSTLDGLLAALSRALPGNPALPDLDSLETALAALTAPLTLCWTNARLSRRHFPPHPAPCFPASRTDALARRPATDTGFDRLTATLGAHLTLILA